MSEPTALELSQERSDLAEIRSHLANERTHLAYVRTGISLISFGVTLNRFSLYLIQNKHITSLESLPFLSDTKNVGIGMVILGSVLLIWSITNYLKTAKNIQRDNFKPSKWSLIIFTSLVTILGVATTLWMIDA